MPLALSFDLLWGYTGIMSFGQALFYGTAAYSAALLRARPRHHLDLRRRAACTLIGLVLALMMAWFLLLGRYPPSTIFVALGTLTGAYAADRLARGWYYLGGQNGIPSIPPLTAGGYDDRRRARILLSRARDPRRRLPALPLARALAIRPRPGWDSPAGGARISFLGYRVQHFKAIIFTLAGGIAGSPGALAAFHDGFVWPNMLGVLLSTQIVLYVLFGGVGTLVGAVIGVAASST